MALLPVTAKRSPQLISDQANAQPAETDAILVHHACLALRLILVMDWLSRWFARTSRDVPSRFCLVSFRFGLQSWSFGICA